MERTETGQEGVVVYRDVPITYVGDQHADAYLHLYGSPREQPSHVIRAFVGDESVSAASGRDHPAFAGQGTTYNSPPAPGPISPASPDGAPADDAGSYDVMLDVSDAVGRLGSAADRADITLVLTDLHGRPLDASKFNFADLRITRHPMAVLDRRGSGG